MSNELKKRLIPNAFNNKEKIYEVQLASPVWLKREGLAITCYIKGAPNGRYLVYNNVLKSAGRSYSIEAKPVILTNGHNSTFQILIRNVEAAYGGSMAFNIDEIIAEAVSF